MDTTILIDALSRAYLVLIKSSFKRQSREAARTGRFSRKSTWGCLGLVLGRLGPSWGCVEVLGGPSWAVLGRLGAILGPSWAVLGHLEPSWAGFGLSWAVLGRLGAEKS